MMLRKLGRSDIEVSALGMGCWAIGGQWWYVGDGEPDAWARTILELRKMMLVKMISNTNGLFFMRLSPEWVRVNKPAA